MKTVSRAALWLAWVCALVQIAALLSACAGGFSETRLGLTVVGLVAFFAFLYVSTIADQSRAAVRAEARDGRRGAFAP